MIFTNAQIFDSVQVLAQAKEEKGLLGYAVAVNLRKMGGEITEYTKKRDELLAEHGKDLGGGKFSLAPEGVAAFLEALRPFSELKTDVAIMQIAPDVFYSGGLTSAQMYALSWMVKEV